MEEKNQINTAATEEEKKLIIATFKDNEPLLKIIRALFLGLGITNEEKKVILALSPAIKKVLWDRFLPTLSKDTPIGQVKDVWLGAETMVFGQPRDSIFQAIQYKDQAIEMTKKALLLLDNPDNPKISLLYDRSLVLKDELGVALLARNQFIRHVESQLYTLWVIANLKTETPKQAAERARKDSAQ